MSDTEKGFYVRSYKRSGDDSGAVFVSDTQSGVSIEGGDFGYCRYKSCSGLESYGEVKTVYTESYAESDGTRVYVGEDAARESTSVTLELYFFGSDPDVSDESVSDDVTEQIVAASESYHKFMDYVSGCYVLYWDDYRQRQVLLYLQNAVETSSDVIKGIPYKEVSFKFSNVFGRSFSMSDTTIDNYLKSGQK